MGLCSCVPIYNVYVAFCYFIVKLLESRKALLKKNTNMIQDPIVNSINT